jgi:hypothetical protein
LASRAASEQTEQLSSLIGGINRTTEPSHIFWLLSPMDGFPETQKTGLLAAE